MLQKLSGYIRRVEGSHGTRIDEPAERPRTHSDHDLKLDVSPAMGVAIFDDYPKYLDIIYQIMEADLQIHVHQYVIFGASIFEPRLSVRFPKIQGYARATAESKNT